jgi:hypothetical protein
MNNYIYEWLFETQGKLRVLYRSIKLNDMPEWVSFFGTIDKTLLGRPVQSYCEKNITNILREYDIEKWGFLREYQLTSNTTILSDFDREFNGKTLSPLLLGDQYFVVDPSLYTHIVSDLLARVWFERSDGFPALIEVGCGYGSILLKVAKKIISNNALALIKHCALSEGLKIRAIKCDFSHEGVFYEQVQKSGFLFSFFSLCCSDIDSKQLAKNIFALNPLVCVFFEPLFNENPKTIIDIVTNFYVKHNKYNARLREAFYLLAGYMDASIEIFENIVSPNPACALSMVVIRRPKVNLPSFYASHN